MNKFKHLILKLKHETDDKFIRVRYNMDDTPVTWSWTDVMLKYYNDGKNKFDLHNEDKNVSLKTAAPELINSWWEKIQFMCKYLNDREYPHKIIFEDSLELNTDNLNLLHKKFHYVSESIVRDNMTVVAGKEIVDCLSKLNVAIHKIENYHKSPYPSYYGVQLFESHLHTNIITDYERRFFKTVQSAPLVPGTIRLGYATIGKKLIDACLNDDVQLVKEGGIRPQTHIKNVFSINIISYTPKTIVQNQRRIDLWLTKNNLSHLIDSSQPEHFFSNQPILAKPDKNYTTDELNSIFSEYSICEFDIE